MKLSPSRTDLPKARRTGVVLIECLVYIAVFAILLGGGTAAFYFCWDHTRAVIFTSDGIESALRAGESWRADVRAATGEISVATTPTGEVVRIPAGGTEIIYRFDGGGLRRETSAQSSSRPLLENVKSSEVKSSTRGGVTAWRWELALAPRRKESQLPLLFTFEAAQGKP